MVGLVQVNHTHRRNMKYFQQDALVYNLRFSIVMARVHYLREEESLPDSDDIRAFAEYYKKHYNTYAGAATIAEAMSNYNKYVK